MTKSQAEKKVMNWLESIKANLISGKQMRCDGETESNLFTALRKSSPGPYRTVMTARLYMAYWISGDKNHKNKYIEAVRTAGE